MSSLRLNQHEMDGIPWTLDRNDLFPKKLHSQNLFRLVCSRVDFPFLVFWALSMLGVYASGLCLVGGLIKQRKGADQIKVEKFYAFALWTSTWRVDNIWKKGARFGAMWKERCKIKRNIWENWIFLEDFWRKLRKNYFWKRVKIWSGKQWLQDKV